jgi:hypothetical protein
MMALTPVSTVEVRRNIVPAEPSDLGRRLDDLSERLAASYADVAGPEAVRSIVYETYDRCFAGAHVSEFVPLFVEKRARETLAGRREQLRGQAGRMREA